MVTPGALFFAEILFTHHLDYGPSMHKVSFGSRRKWICGEISGPGCNFSYGEKNIPIAVVKNGSLFFAEIFFKHHPDHGPSMHKILFRSRRKWIWGNYFYQFSCTKRPFSMATLRAHISAMEQLRHMSDGSFCSGHRGVSESEFS